MLHYNYYDILWGIKKTKTMGVSYAFASVSDPQMNGYWVVWLSIPITPAWQVKESWFL